MVRIRATGIVLRGDRILLMHRFHEGEAFYVFPGGQTEVGEQVSQAVAREIREETSIKVGAERLLYRVIWDNGEESHYYLCGYLSGEPALAKDAEERGRMNAENVFQPLWVEVKNLPELKVYQLEVRDLMLKDMQNNFAECPRELRIKISERRQK